MKCKGRQMWADDGNEFVCSECGAVAKRTRDNPYPTMVHKTTSITKRERTQLVELLKCAADVSSIVQAGYGTGHCDGINPCTPVFALAREAYAAVPGVLHPDGWHAYPDYCLEAAARVEEGSWP